jgi:stage II sporulation protein D
MLYPTSGMNKTVEVRILIEKQIKELKIKTENKVFVISDKQDEKYLLLEDSEYEVIPSNNGLMINDIRFSSPIFLETVNPFGYIVLNGKRYQGRIKIKNSNGLIDVIEHIGLESYIIGVLGPEMGTTWPIEALKAQAVSARTYTLASLNKNYEYDLTNTVYDQVYNGHQTISPAIIAAVNQTRGEILTYKGKVFFAYYHANSGGHTTSPSATWNSDSIIPPLRGVKDPYFKYSPNAYWECYVPSSDIIKFLLPYAASKKNISKIKEIRVLSKDRSQRAIKLLISTDAGKFKVDISNLRKHIGTFDLKSTLITRIEKLKNGFKFYGRGWGHGVGLCQDGAKAMADKGYDYKKILQFYYPGSKITKIEEIYDR